MTILIIILLIITIIFIICKCRRDYFNSEQLISKEEIIKFEREIDSIISLDLYNENETKNIPYRIGDVFYSCENKKIFGKNDLELYNTNYPESIATEYLLRSNKKQLQWNILTDIIKKRFKKNDNLINNKSNICLMHVRVGDVIEEIKKYDKLFILKKFKYDIKKVIGPWNQYYINTENFYKNKSLELKKLNINKLYIFCGSHKIYDNYKHSTWYLYKIINIFENNNINCELIYGRTADEDILYSLNFNYFIPSKGNYSKLIKDINFKINTNFKII